MLYPSDACGGDQENNHWVHFVFESEVMFSLLYRF